MTPDAAAIPAFSTAASSSGLRSRRDSSDMTAVEDTVAAIAAAASVPRAAPSRLPATYPAKERPVTRTRSEEHTSELQSLMRISYAVFCLKKKKKQYKQENSSIIIKQTSTSYNTNI